MNMSVTKLMDTAIPSVKFQLIKLNRLLVAVKNNKVKALVSLNVMKLGY
jgi:hypothetical protein